VVVSEDKVNNEELTAFVTSTLNAIAEGVEQAAELSRAHKTSGYSTFEMPETVQFDVAVSARSSGELGGGLKLKVFDVGAEGGGKKTSSSETISRIVFEIPWRYTRTAPMPKPSRGIRSRPA
jgi:hypothetical protein